MNTSCQTEALILLQLHSVRSALLVPVHFDGQIIDSNHHRCHCSRHTHSVDQSTDYRADESTQEDEVSCGHIILKTLFLTFFGRKLQQKRKDQEETLREAKDIFCGPDTPATLTRQAMAGRQYDAFLTLKRLQEQLASQSSNSESAAMASRVQALRWLVVSLSSPK